MTYHLKFGGNMSNVIYLQMILLFILVTVVFLVFLLTYKKKSLDTISLWCANNAKDIHRVKNECMVVTTRKKHQRASSNLAL